MKRLLLFVVTVLCVVISQAQLLTWTPPFPKENDPSQTLEITVDATKGNQGLLNFSGDVYVHIGVITNKSANGDDWKYVPFQWATSPANGKAASLGNNKWKYTIAGSLRTFFGITDATETIQKIAILFRNADGTRAQRNTDASNMYIPVYTASLAVRLTGPPREPKFIPTPETQNWSVGTAFTISADASQASTLKLYHNGTVVGTAANATSITAASTVTLTGNQQLVAEATTGGVTQYDTINIFVGSAPVASLPQGVKDGINYGADNTSVTLVLRAPGKGFVTVIGDFNNWTQAPSYIMNKTPDGKFFWLTVNRLTPGTEYAFQYIVDGTLKIADPYAEKILDPNNDKYISPATYPALKPYPAGQSGIVSVLQTAPPAYTWAVSSFTRPAKKG
ncbi:MAG TPA: hypothetical protein VFT06_05855, partial [Flavisolibacter sp.]|nr:hypothetical protein [Flavisolibacter sp.]